jgi:hypothetical protein
MHAVRHSSVLDCQEEGQRIRQATECIGQDVGVLEPEQAKVITICGLFIDAISSSDCVASNDRMLNEC